MPLPLPRPFPPGFRPGFSRRASSSGLALLLAAPLGLLTTACTSTSPVPKSTTTAPTTVVAPTITTQPAAQGITVGGSATFSVVATGTALSYQWQLDGAHVGSNAATCTLGSDLASGSYSVTVIVTNSAGSVTSHSATLTVTGTPTVSLAAQSGTLSSAVPGSAAFAATTANLADGTVGSVTWYTSAAGTTVGSAPAGVTPTVGDVASNAATVTLTADASTVAGTYYFTATFGAATSSVATLSVPEVIVYPDTAAVDYTPTDARVPAGQTLIVDATALTGGYTLTWNGSAETDGAFYINAGVTTATLTGGAGADTFDFTTHGVSFSAADTVNGGGGTNTLKLGAMSGTNALAHVTNVKTITFTNEGAISITTPNTLVATGQTLTVDASALAGSNTFTWDGSAESDGAFDITAGSSTARITGGNGNNTIHGGSGTNTITGGNGDDTIYGGSGTNTIDGGPGSNTIVLGAHTGVDTIQLTNLTSGVDTISGFMGTGTTHDVIYVSTLSGLYFVAGSGYLVSSGDPAVALVVTAANATTLTYSGDVNMLILVDAPYSDSQTVGNALAAGGSDELTFESGTGAGTELLVVYSDGANAHLLGIFSPTYSAGPSSLNANDMVYTDLATISGVKPNDLTSWTDADFHF